MEVKKSENCDQLLPLRMVPLKVNVTNAKDFGNQNRRPFGFDFELTAQFLALMEYVKDGNKLFLRIYCLDENENVVSYDSEHFHLDSNFYNKPEGKRKKYRQIQLFFLLIPILFKQQVIML
jgi:hypothetical protein